MNIVAIIISIILAIAATFHVGWAFGNFWPAKDEYSLVKTVIGEPNMREMPSRNFMLIVVFSLFLGIIAALWGAYLISVPLPLWMREFGLFIFAFIFGTRGLSTFLIAKQLGERTQPFKNLDRALYAPLCIIISVGYILMLVNN